MPAKKGLKIRLIALQEAAHLKGENRCEHQENDDEDIGQGRREIAAQFAPKNHEHLVHTTSSAAGAALMPSGSVSDRNTSSRRPDSKCNSGTSHLYLTIIALTADNTFDPGLGMAVRRSSRASDSTAATSGSSEISRTAALSSSPLSNLKLTAWW